MTVLLGTIARDVVVECEIKKSRFRCQLTRVDTVEAASAVIAAARKQFWDATHNCSAFVVGTAGEHQRSNDDGEPGGTAGLPMLDAIRTQHLTDVVAVVTRYFGGTLLGTGGLVRAYAGSVAQAIRQAGRLRRIEMTEVALDVPIADSGRLEHRLRTWLAESGGIAVDSSYGAVARHIVAVPPEAIDALHSWAGESGSGAWQLTPLGPRIVECPDVPHTAD